METDSGVVDKNLYAYCDGNPVMRKDKDGEYWQLITGAIGALIGAGFEAASQISEYGEIKDVKQILIASATGALCGAFPNFAVYFAFGGTLLQQMLAFDVEFTPSYITNAVVDSVVAASCTRLLQSSSKNIINNIKQLTSSKVTSPGKVLSKKNIGSTAKRIGAIAVHSNALLHVALFGSAISFAFQNVRRELSH
jgi:hypothetical protein